MGQISIRRAVLSDLPYFYEICLKTGNEGGDASALFSDPYLIGHYYAAPYLIFESGICFAAEYEYRPQGYIIAVPDTASFKEWMEKQWLPPIRKLYRKPFPISEKEKEIIERIHDRKFPIDSTEQPWLTDYPAHLHIDILPCIQGKGYGRVLIDTLFNELARKGVPGLHLGVASSNQSAIAFYKKMGFTVLGDHDWGLTMGKRC